MRDRTILLVLAACFCAYLFTAAPIGPGDDHDMLMEADRIASHGFATLPDAPNALTFSKFGIGQTLLDLPVVPFYRAMVASTSPDGGWGTLGVGVLAAALAAATVGLLLLIARRLGYSPRTICTLGLLAGFGTLTWKYSQNLYADTTIGLCAIAALYAALRHRQGGRILWLWLASAAIGFAVLCKVTAIVLAPILLYYVWRSSRRPGVHLCPKRATTALAMPLIVAAAIYLWYNNLRYGDPLNFGYTGEQDRDRIFGFNTPLWIGLYGLLLSTGKGLFWFSPVCILSLLGWRRFHRRHSDESVVVALTLLALLLLHAKWWAWHGDWSYGPRFLAGFGPLLLLPAATWIETTWRLPSAGLTRRLRLGATVLLLLVGATVQLLGLVIDPVAYIIISSRKQQIFAASSYDPVRFPIRDDGVQTHFIPHFSPIDGQWWMLRGTLARQDPDSFAQVLRTPPWARLNPNWHLDSGDQQANANLQSYFRFQIWWLAARQAGAPGHLAKLIVATILAILGLACLIRAIRCRRLATSSADA